MAESDQEEARLEGQRLLEQIKATRARPSIASALDALTVKAVEPTEPTSETEQTND